MPTPTSRADDAFPDSPYAPGFGLPHYYRLQILLIAERSSVKEAARQAGISDTAIYQWRKRIRGARVAAS